MNIKQKTTILLSIFTLAAGTVWGATRLSLTEDLYLKYAASPKALGNWIIGARKIPVENDPHKDKFLPGFSTSNHLYGITQFLAEVISFGYEEGYEGTGRNFSTRINMYGQSTKEVSFLSKSVEKMTGLPLVLNKDEFLIQYNPMAISALFDKLYISPNETFMGLKAQDVYNLCFLNSLKKLLFVLCTLGQKPDLLKDGRRNK